MKQGEVIGIGAAAIMAAAFGWIVFRCVTPSTHRMPDINAPLSSVTLSNPTRQLAPINAMKFVDLQTVHFVVTSTPAIGSGHVLGGVVNHHVLAVDLLARFWAAIAVARPDATRIVIISPDHYKQGAKPISVHERTYLTDEGSVFIDVTATRLLLKDSNIGEENGAMFENEHGIGALVPFLHHVLPQAQIVPIAIRGNSDVGSVIRLGQELKKIIDPHTLVIVSSDMSHYLDEQTALNNDKTTEGWFKTRDQAAMEKATDRNTDNGLGFAALFEVVRGQNVSFTRLDHSISTRYNGPKDNTTSYLTGVWSAPGS